MHPSISQAKAYSQIPNHFFGFLLLPSKSTNSPDFELLPSERTILESTPPVVVLGVSACTPTSFSCAFLYSSRFCMSSFFLRRSAATSSLLYCVCILSTVMYVDMVRMGCESNSRLLGRRSRYGVVRTKFWSQMYAARKLRIAWISHYENSVSSYNPEIRQANLESFMVYMVEYE
jgi:hypothetical protein